MPNGATSETKLEKHYLSNRTFYVRWVDEMAKYSGETIASGTVDFSADSAITAGAVTATSAEVTDTDCDGNTVTIPAGKGTQFSLSGGTKTDGTGDWLRADVSVTLSGGAVIGKTVLFKVIGA